MAFISKTIGFYPFSWFRHLDMGAFLFGTRQSDIQNNSQTTHQYKQSSSGGWTVIIILAIIIGGWILFSQAQDKSDYNKSLRVLGAKQECRAEARREGWSEAEAGCDKLGTPGYDMSTDNYFNAYKLRTGAKEL